MKRKVIFIGAIIVLLILVIISVTVITKNVKTQKPEDNNVLNGENEDKNNSNYSTFKGTILSSSGIYEQVARVYDIGGTIEIIVEPDENEEIRKSSDKVSIVLKESDGNSYDPGTRVEVTYDVASLQEIYPLRVKCINIKEIQNKTISMYETMIENLIKEDDTLNQDAKFIAIDFENFLTYRKDQVQGGYCRSLSENEKKEIINYCKSYNPNVIESTMEELKDQGHFNEETMSLDGILISVDKVDSIIENKAIVRMNKYRSALGAIMPKYELNLQNDFDWDIKVVDMAIS